MKHKTNILVIVLNCILLPMKAQWNDNFSDGDFKSNPCWLGDTAKFEVDASLQLHLNAPAVSGKACLFTPSVISTSASWKFTIQLEFNPSSGNYAKVILMSDKNNPDSSWNGYFIRLGYTSDDISLLKQEGTSSTVLIDGPNSMLNYSSNRLSIRVSRDSEGGWTLFADTTGAFNYSVIGSAIDSSFRQSNYFGVQCIYTSTRSTKFWFDNFEVTGRASNDSVPPTLATMKVESDSSVQFRFSEKIDFQTINRADFSLSQAYTIREISKTDEYSFSLKIRPDLTCQNPVSLSLRNIRDLAGNPLRDTVLTIRYCPGELFDVLITEIMPDPEPSAGLPEVEYMELYNRTSTAINLENWRIQVGNELFTIPMYLLPPDSFLIVTSKNGCAAFGSHTACLGLLSSYALNNDAEYLGLLNRENRLIHWVHYANSWFEPLKADGGWSLELTDPAYPCEQKGNWHTSISASGGTPFRRNSKAEMTRFDPFNPLHLHILNDSSIRLYFSKAVDGGIEERSWLFQADNGLGAPLKLTSDPLERRFVDLTFGHRFAGGLNYTLTLSDEIKDCSGNPLNNMLTFPFGKPSDPEPGDIVINEVLFHSKTDQGEFVELYNNSDKFINTESLRFAYHSGGAEFKTASKISDSPFLFPPKSYLVLTQSREILEENYAPGNIQAFSNLTNFPVLSDDEGCVALFQNDLQVIDQFCYSEKMHFPLLVNTAGVSLERIHFKGSSNDSSNWHSAASTVNYATPGYRNSQSLDETTGSEGFFLDNELFSPDNDGYKDNLTVGYLLQKNGYMATILVFDAVGRKIRTLANNAPLGTQGEFLWDGLDEAGKITPTGIYLIYIQLHHPSGEVKTIKKPCVVAGSLK